MSTPSNTFRKHFDTDAEGNATSYKSDYKNVPEALYSYLMDDALTDEDFTLDIESIKSLFYVIQKQSKPLKLGKKTDLISTQLSIFEKQRKIICAIRKALDESEHPTPSSLKNNRLWQTIPIGEGRLVDFTDKDRYRALLRRDYASRIRLEDTNTRLKEVLRLLQIVLTEAEHASGDDAAQRESQELMARLNDVAKAMMPRAHPSPKAGAGGASGRSSSGGGFFEPEASTAPAIKPITPTNSKA